MPQTADETRTINDIGKRLDETRPDERPLDARLFTARNGAAARPLAQQGHCLYSGRARCLGAARLPAGCRVVDASAGRTCSCKSADAAKRSREVCRAELAA